MNAKILDVLISIVNDELGGNSFRIYPGMIRLLHLLVTSFGLPRDELCHMPLEAYSRSICSYDPQEAEQYLELMAVIIPDDGQLAAHFECVSNILLFKPAFEFKSVCYRLLLQDRPIIATFALSTGLIPRCAWLLDEVQSELECYFGVILFIVELGPDTPSLLEMLFLVSDDSGRSVFGSIALFINTYSSDSPSLLDD
jgi:hypothetical protein